MKASLVFVACFAAALSAVHADTGAPHPAAPQAVHHEGGPHPQQQQVAFGQQQQAAPLPYPIRRQSNNGFERARAAVMGMVESIMHAGSRFRKMASARLSTMFRRRAAPAAPLRRSYPQQVQPVAAAPQPQPHHQTQQQPQAQFYPQQQ